MKKLIVTIICVCLFVGLFSPTLLPTADASTWYTKLFSGGDRDGDFATAGFGGGQRGGWGSSSSGSGLISTDFGFSEISYQTLSDLVVTINSWIAARVYYDLFGSVLYNAKIRYNSTAGYYYIVAYSDVTNKVYSFTDNAGNIYIAHKESLAIPDVNVDVSVNTTTFDDTNVLTALYGIWQTMLLQVDCQLITAESILTDAQVNLAVLTRLDDVISPMLGNISDWLSGIYGYTASMADSLSELQQLYPSDATMTISSGDTLDWDSAYKQDPVSSFEHTLSTSPIIYMTGVNGFSGNADWTNGVLTLTPSSGIYFPQTITVGSTSIDMPSHIVSTATPNPAYVGLPDGYTQYESISSTGTQYLILPSVAMASSTVNISFSAPAARSGNEYIWGNLNDGVVYLNTSGSNCYFNIYAENNNSSSRLGTFAFTPAVKNDLSFCFRSGYKSVTLNGVALQAYSPSYSLGTYSRGLFSCFAGASGTYPQGYAKISVYGYSVIASDGTLLTNLVPCANPSGAVGMYNTVTSTFIANSGTGTFQHGAEVPAMVGTDVIDYYNVTKIYRGAMVGEAYQWYAVDDTGAEHVFLVADCQRLDSAFSAVSYNSIDVFLPRDGSYTVVWDDSRTGDIVINYKSMSRFFTWLYRFLNTQQKYVENTILPALQGTGDNVSQSINTTINNITVDDTDLFYDVYNFGDGDNIVDAGKDGINKIGGLLKWLWGNTFKGAFENADIGALDGLIPTYPDDSIS